VQGVARAMGLEVEIQSIANPRKEKEEHYYNVRHSALL
jgi:UDP-sulfoquinovose synthase